MLTLVCNCSCMQNTPHLSQSPSYVQADGNSPSPPGVNNTTAHLRHSSSDSLSRPQTASGSNSSQQAPSNTAASGSLSSLQQQQPGSVAAVAAAVHAEQIGARRRSEHHQHSSTGVVVDECMMRWVPYKHANGMSIYYRQTPQEEGRGMPQVGGLTAAAVKALLAHSCGSLALPLVSFVCCLCGAAVDLLHFSILHLSISNQSGSELHNPACCDRVAPQAAPLLCLLLLICRPLVSTCSVLLFRPALSAV